jgi:thioredoxin reductase
MYDLIIVGGGPAGLTAAVYAICKRLNVLVVSQDLGGKTNYHLTLPEMEMHQVIRGQEVVEKFRRELEYLDFARRQAMVKTITKKDNLFIIKATGGSELTTKTVILATGAQAQRLNVPGERDYVGWGLSYSALSYAPLFLGKRAVVIGDEERGLRAVAELAQVAAQVHFITPKHEALDTPLSRKLATDSPNVTVLAEYTVKAIRGNDFASHVVVESPEGKETEIDTDGIFIELTLLANSEPIKGWVDLDEQGRVIIDNRNRTSCPGLFAAGDVTNAYAEQVLIAVGEGAKAALSAYEYLLYTF